MKTDIWVKQTRKTHILSIINLAPLTIDAISSGYFSQSQNYCKNRFIWGHTNFSTSRGIVGGFVKTQLGWSYGRPPVWIWKMPIFRYLIFWNVISRSLGQSLSLVFLPVRIGRNPDSTEFTRSLSGSVRLINRHCPGTVTIATSSSLSLVLSYILPQIVLCTRQADDLDVSSV